MRGDVVGILANMSVCLSPDCLFVGSLLISTDCLSVVASSVREHLSQLVRHQTDEFATDFKGLPVRQCFDTDFNGSSVRRCILYVL